MTDKRHESSRGGSAVGWALPIALVVGMGLPIAGTLALTSLLPAWSWLSLPLHSALEAGGAALGLVLAAVLLFSRHRGHTSRRMWVACALVSMAALDLCHSCVPLGHMSNRFVWLHSLAVLAGGVLFALVWLPERPVSPRTALTTAGAALLAAAIAGLLSALYPQAVPRMVADGGFTFLAEAINLAGGGLMLLAALNFALAYAAGRNREELLFLLLCLLFGGAGALFHLSAPWEAGWWLWHALRFGGYLVALWLAMLSYRSSEELLRAHSELDGFFCTAADGKRLIDRDFNQLRINDTFARLAGVSREAAARTKCYQAFGGALCHSDECPLKQLEAGSTQSIQQEIVKTRSDGAEVVCIMNAARLTAPDGSFQGVMESFWDITDRKQAEEQIQHLNATLRAIRNVNQLITKEKDRGRLLEGACRILTEGRGYFSAWVALMGPHGEAQATFEAGLGEAFSPLAEQMRRGQLPACARRALGEPGVAAISSPPASCQGCPLVGCYPEKVGSLSARLEHEGQVYGVITVSIATAVMGEQEEQALFHELAGDLGFALRGIEVGEEQRRAEETLRQNARELAVRNRIIQVFLTVPDEEMYTQVLTLILEALESQYGVFGFLDEAGNLVVPTMTRTVWDQCQVPDKQFVFPRETWGDGSWPTAIRKKRTICLNERSTRTPQGHIEISRHISLPVMHQGGVVGLIQVANKESDYTAEDVALLETLGAVIAPVLDARLKRERQEAARQRAEESLARRTQELERSNRELEQFAYVASHDLQEPLRMVSSYTQLIARRYRGQLDADADEFIAFAVDGANRMQQLIQDLLSYSRVNTRGQPFAATDCHTVLGQVRVNLSAAIAESGALVTNDELPVVMADQGQVVQLFQNLIGNAIKFHKPGEPPRVHVSAQKTSEVWTFSVRDNGIGIEPQYHERIFVIFQRLHAREEYPGTGIGLAICKRIVERHGGRMWVESELGEGATFYFTLPAVGNQDHE
ncbi:MAG: ATP-binding protein [Chloroflexota bacterium]